MYYKQCYNVRSRSHSEIAQSFHPIGQFHCVELCMCVCKCGFFLFWHILLLLLSNFDIVLKECKIKVRSKDQLMGWRVGLGWEGEGGGDIAQGKPAQNSQLQVIGALACTTIATIAWVDIGKGEGDQEYLH